MQDTYVIQIDREIFIHYRSSICFRPVYSVSNQRTYSYVGAGFVQIDTRLIQFVKIVVTFPSARAKDRQIEIKMAPTIKCYSRLVKLLLLHDCRQSLMRISVVGLKKVI